MSHERKPRWRREGKRFLRRDGPDFNGFIFAAMRPRKMWAWAIYASGGRHWSGVEHSLSNARSRANIRIEEVEFMRGTHG